MHSRARRRHSLGRMFVKLSISVVLLALVFCLTVGYIVRARSEQEEQFVSPVLTSWKASSRGTLVHEEKNVVGKGFNFVIKVLAYDRIFSLRRCLKSLAAADYGGDTVPLVIFVDHLPAAGGGSSGRKLVSDYDVRDLDNENETSSTVETDWDSLGEDESDAEDPIERNIIRARQTLRFVDKFYWPHGPKEVLYRSKNLGLQGQWIEAWWPSSDDQFALIVEDDMELSPVYYRFVRSIISNYYYDPENADPSIFGVSLQRPRFVAGIGGRSIQVENTTRLFLYQMLGSWGQVLFPKQWKEFRLWYDAQRIRDKDPLLGGMVTSGWYRKLGDKIWTPWFVKFVHSRGYFNLHTNFLHERALSVSHRAKGVNYHQDAGPDSKLIRKGLTDIDMWEIPALSTVKWYDFCFQQVFPGRLASSTSELKRFLPSLHHNHTVLLVGTVDVSESILKNWLCQLSSLRMKQHLLVASSRDLSTATELSRRGYAVMMVEQEDEEDAAEPFSVYSRAIRQVLNLGYDVWFARPDVVWLNSSLFDIETSTFDVLAATRSSKDDEEFNTGLLFLRRTAMVALEASQGTLLSSKSVSKLRVGDLSTAGISSLPAGSTVIDRATKAVLLEESLSAKAGDILRASGLWLVDEELACKRVYC